MCACKSRDRCTCGSTLKQAIASALLLLKFTECQIPFQIGRKIQIGGSAALGLLTLEPWVRHEPLTHARTIFGGEDNGGSGPNSKMLIRIFSFVLAAAAAASCLRVCVLQTTGLQAAVRCYIVNHYAHVIDRP